MIVKMIPAVPMGNCYKLKADGECIAVLPTEDACDLFIKVFSRQLPNTSGQTKEWIIELNWIPGLAF